MPRTLASTCVRPSSTPVSADRPSVAFTGPAEAEALPSSALAKALALSNSVEASAPALGPLASASKMLHSARALLSVEEVEPGRSMFSMIGATPGSCFAPPSTTAKR